MASTTNALTSAATAYSLVTPDELMEQYRPAKKLKASSALWQVCLAASRSVERYLQRNVMLRSYTLEKYDGTGDVYLALRNAPVTSVTAVERDAVAQTLTEFELVKPSLGLLYYAGGFDAPPIFKRGASVGLMAAPVPGDSFFADAAGADTAGLWAVSYSGGWTNDDPELWEIRQVALEKAILLIKESPMLGTASMTIDNVTESRWANGDQGTMERWRATLSPYRRVL